MMVAACANDKMPTLTKPMTITVTAPLLWMAAVPTVPIPTPIHLFRPVFENSCFSRFDDTASRWVLIIWQATRNTPMPAVKVRIAIKMLVKSIV